MARLITYSLLAFALSMLAIAAPLILPRQTFPSNVSPGTVTAGCVEFVTIQPGITCAVIEQVFNITDATFHALNPQVNSECTNLMEAEAYCAQTVKHAVAPPSNIAQGTITTGCAAYFTVQSGQACNIITDIFAITLADFVRLNPQINSLCSNLFAGEAYCVETASG